MMTPEGNQSYLPDRYGYVPEAIPTFEATEAPIEPRRDDFASVKIQESTGWLSEYDDAAKKRDAPCWLSFGFILWALVVVVVIAVIIALSVTLVVVQNNRNSGSTNPQNVPLGVSKPTTTTAPGTSSTSGTTTSGNSPAPTATPGITAAPPGRTISDKDGTLVIMENPPFSVPSGFTALWWEEFDGTSLNTDFWNFDTGYGEAYGLWQWGNQELEYYTTDPNNVLISNGTLQVIARNNPVTINQGTPNQYAFNYTSGRVQTKGKAAFFGGMTTADGRKWNTLRVEASLKSPLPSSGLWAAFWMLPIDMRYGVWASSGEIDIYEMKNGFTNNNMALHFGGPFPGCQQRYNLNPPAPNGMADYSKGFVTVTMDWTPSNITMYMNGKQQLTLPNLNLDTLKSGNSQSWCNLDPSLGYWSQAHAFGAPLTAPFDMPFYFVINLAVGGKYPGDVGSDAIFPNAFSVDYIRVYGKP